jgi:hypothetical protein
MKRIKLITIASILILVGIVASNSRQFSSSAKSDEVFAEIGKYKSWKMISKPVEKNEAGAFAVFDSSAMG